MVKTKFYRLDLAKNNPYSQYPVIIYYKGEGIHYTRFYIVGEHTIRIEKIETYIVEANDVIKITEKDWNEAFEDIIKKAKEW